VPLSYGGHRGLLSLESLRCGGRSGPQVPLGDRGDLDFLKSQVARLPTQRERLKLWLAAIALIIVVAMLFFSRGL
jgi:hypothetical protein